MSVQQKNRSFFSTTAGAITGVAGVLTAVVGILGAATQLGWIGSKGDSSSSASTSTTAQPSVSVPVGGLLPTTTTPPGASGSRSQTTDAVQLRADPASVDFDRLGRRDTVVKVFNEGRSTVALQVSVDGPDRSSFTAAPAASTCNSLATGLSCDIKVTFAPSRAGEYTAKVVIRAGSVATEVPLKAVSLL